MLLTLLFSLAFAGDNFNHLKKQCDQGMSWGYRQGGSAAAAITQKTLENLHGEFSSKADCEVARDEDTKATSECVKRYLGEKVSGEYFTAKYMDTKNEADEMATIQFATQARCDKALQEGFKKRAYGQKLEIGPKDSESRIRFLTDCQAHEMVICEKYAEKASVPPLF